MRAAKKTKIDKQILHDLVPLNALSESRFGKLAEKIIVEEVKAGKYLFRKGDRDGNSVYLLDGKVSLIDASRNVTGEIEAGTDKARYPIANLHPRALSARAACRSVVARVDTNLLDVFLSCDQTQTADVVEIDGADTGDWMTRILQSEVFSKLPPAKIQSLLLKMQPFSVKAGETIISQGDKGDYFYTIHEGRCAVTRRQTPDAEDVQLAVLGDGDSFGEEALVTNTLRNATITMLTDGTLMRLAKRDFVELLKKQLVRHIDSSTAQAMVEEGAVWLDVRTPEEYERGAFEDSVNIPLADLRNEASELVFNATYILCCDTGGRSGSAAFMLSHKGFDVYVLEGGITALPPGDLEAAGMSLQYAGHNPDSGPGPAAAQVIDFETGRHDPEPAAEHEPETVTAAAAPMQAPADTVAGQPGTAAQQAGKLAELQRENTALLGEIKTYRNTEQRLTEQLELLRAELAEAGEKLGEMYSQAGTEADEKQLLRDQYAALQEEFKELQQAHRSTREETAGRIEELQQQLDNARLESQAGTGRLSDELGDARANNQRIEEALAAALDKATSLEAQLATAMEAQSLHQREAAAALQEQQGRVRQLQDELQRQGEVNAQLQQTLAASSDQERTAGDALRGQLREMEGRVEGLTGELEEVRTTLQKKAADLAAESARALELGHENQELHASLESARSSISQLQADSGRTSQEQQGYLEELRAELAAATAAGEQLRRELEEALSARDATYVELRAQQDAAGGHTAQVEKELAGLRCELSESAAQLATEQERLENLQQQYDGQARELEKLQAEIETSRQERDVTTVAAREQQQALEHELEALRGELEGATERSRESQSGLETAAATIQDLENRKDELSAALQEAQSRLVEQLEHATVLADEKQQALDALSRQDEAHAAERDALSGQLQAARQETAQLQADFNTERKRLEDALEQQQSQHSDLLAEHEASVSRLQESLLENEATLAQMQAEQQELQRKYTAELEEKTGLQARVAAQEERFAAAAADKERQFAELQASFRDGQAEIETLRLRVGEKDTQLDALQREISEREENRRLIEEQLEAGREANGRLREEMEQFERTAREAEAEYQESIRKAHDDLTRKNDNARELQGQIDRLRKQLEQATLDLHRQRESAQGDVDHLREQLHAERRERAGERAEMAARQRELKEQLANIATAHEANLGKHSGDLEQARDTIRAEEQERLREVLEAQALTEDRVQKLQQELYKAHEEISELTLQQKSTRRVDVELLQEQNQQAVSTIAQLESQLRQLSDERDSALEEQGSLRERVNALRGEVEVARGLMNLHGEDQAENPARLRSELDEAKKDVEIAVRLRAEAEAAHDRVLRERDQLREQLAESENRQELLHVPALDGPAAGTREKTGPGQADGGQAAAGRNKPAGTSPAKTKSGHLPAERRSRWTGPLAGLGISGIVALVVWLLLADGNPLPGISSVLPQLEKFVFETAARSILEDTAVVQDAGTARYESVEETVTDAVSPVGAGPDDRAAGSKTAASPVKAVRSFRNTLRDGGKGPVMVELPAATYKMGSLGNSLNFDESPRHKVALPGFSISKYEVTFAEYARFAAATGRRLPPDESWGRANRPVINVSWKDAVAYTQWLSRQTGKTYRLPTEAEWEFAVRAGGSSLHWWDDEPAGVYANCFNCGSEWDNRQTSPVGSFPANRFGLHDMAGNVQEWTQDCYQTGYADAPADGSALLKPQCTQRSVRGGGYTSPLDTLRSARRGQYDENTRLDNLGFRVVREN